MLLGTAGFVVHSLLPLRYRLPFFVLLSLAAIGIAFGPVDGLFLVAPRARPDRDLPPAAAHGRPRFSCWSPPERYSRCWRMELLPAPWSVAIWPILASMFMFRLALYLHALKHDKRRPTPARTLAYFFMLPNVCFPLYPVVDYSTFGRTYYDRGRQRNLRDRYQVDRPRADPPAPVPLRLPAPRARSGGAAHAGRPRAVPARHVPALPAHLGPVPSDHRRAAPVRVPPAGDAPPLLPRVQLHRLLAPHQHLLEGLHDEAGVLPELLPVAPLGRHHGARRRHRDRVLRHLDSSLLPVVLAARRVSAGAAGWAVLGRSWARWSWSGRCEK